MSTAAAARTEQIEATVRRYLAAVGSGTAAEIAACYSPEATLEDPVGSEPRRGREAIAEFFGPLEASRRSTELLTLRIGGGEAAFRFRVRTELPDGAAESEPIDVMTFDADGLITSMRAFWSEADVRTGV